MDPAQRPTGVDAPCCERRAWHRRRNDHYALTDAAWSGERISGGLFVSEDEGRTWREALGGLTDRIVKAGSGQPPRLRAISASQSRGAVAYVGFEGLRLEAGAAGLYNGVARTDDGGRTWRIVHRESNQPSPAMSGSWLEERAVMPGPDIWFDAPYDIAVSPRNVDIVYVTDLFRAYRTLDGGSTWTQVHSKTLGPSTVPNAGSNRWTTRGLDVTNAYGVHVDPLDSSRIFISYTDIGLFRSEDGGNPGWSRARACRRTGATRPTGLPSIPRSPG